MSLLKPSGSTRRWRRVRRYVLDRDGWVCHYPVAGGLCLAPANTAGHIIARAEWPAGVPGVDDPANLRAECARHNYRGGAAITNGTEPPTRPMWRSPMWPD